MKFSTGVPNAGKGGSTRSDRPVGGGARFCRKPLPRAPTSASEQGRLGNRVEVVSVST